MMGLPERQTEDADAMEEWGRMVRESSLDPDQMAELLAIEDRTLIARVMKCRSLGAFLVALPKIDRDVHIRRNFNELPSPYNLIAEMLDE
jgi:hypothetical protein